VAESLKAFVAWLTQCQVCGEEHLPIKNRFGGTQTYNIGADGHRYKPPLPLGKGRQVQGLLPVYLGASREPAEPVDNVTEEADQ